MIAVFRALTLHESAIFHPYCPRQGLRVTRKNTACDCDQSIVKSNLRNDRRLEWSETAVCDRAARRALKVERGDADLGGGARLDGLESEHEHFGVGGGSGRLVRDADENRAVRADAVAETSCLFCAEIATGPNRHGFEDSRVETQLHRRRANLLARGHAQRDVEAGAR